MNLPVLRSWLASYATSQQEAVMGIKRGMYHLDNEGNIIAECAWFSGQGNDIETSSKGFCSFGCVRPKGGVLN